MVNLYAYARVYACCAFLNMETFFFFFFMLVYGETKQYSSRLYETITHKLNSVGTVFWKGCNFRLILIFSAFLKKKKKKKLTERNEK